MKGSPVKYLLYTLTGKNSLDEDRRGRRERRGGSRYGIKLSEPRPPALLISPLTNRSLTLKEERAKTYRQLSREYALCQKLAFLNFLQLI
jgi:hypothetical protein